MSENKTSTRTYTTLGSVFGAGVAGYFAVAAAKAASAAIAANVVATAAATAATATVATAAAFSASETVATVTAVAAANPVAAAVVGAAVVLLVAWGVYKALAGKKAAAGQPAATEEAKTPAAEADAEAGEQAAQAEGKKSNFYANAKAAGTGFVYGAALMGQIALPFIATLTATSAWSAGVLAGAAAIGIIAGAFVVSHGLGKVTTSLYKTVNEGRGFAERRWGKAEAAEQAAPADNVVQGDFAQAAA